MKKQSLEKCIDLLNRIGALEYVPEPLDEFVTQLISALDKITVDPKNEGANKIIESAVKSYNSLIQSLDSIAILDKQRSAAFNALEEMRNLSGGDVLPDIYDQAFINNNYDLFCAMLENDISEKLSFEIDEEIRADFLNDIEKIKETFNNIVLDDFKIGKDKNNEIYVNKIIPENTLSDMGSKFLNNRLTEIISMHNHYCISRTQKQAVDKLQEFFENNNYDLVKDKSGIVNIIKDIHSKLLTFKNCNFVKTNQEYDILNKKFYEIQNLFDNAARIFLETKDKEMIDKFVYFREVSPEEFVDVLKKAQSSISPKRAWRYDTTLSIEDFKKRKAKCFITPFKSAISIAENGEILSLCLNAKDLDFVSLNDAFNFIKAHGGKFMYCFEGLSKIYTKYGFEEKSRKPWNSKIEDKAIKNGWDPSFGTEDEVEIRIKNDELVHEHIRSLEENIVFYTEKKNEESKKSNKYKNIEITNNKNEESR